VYGNLILIRNDGAVVDSFGPVDLNQWYHMEMKVYVDAAGTIELRIDGVLAGYETGVDTADSTSTTNYILFGGDQYNSDYRPDGLIYSISDFYVMDDTGTYCKDFLGNGARVDFVLPTADGATTQFTPSAGAVNYAMIDEAWHDYDNTRNVNGTVGNKDTFEVDDLSEITKGDIHAIKPLMIAKKSDATARTCNLVQRQNSVEGDSSAVTLAEDFGYHSGVFYTNPDTAAQWTKAEFTSSEFGYKNAS
jgi:hypothetical protein